jgi:formylmethanofuran dehydrogenase subunit E
MSVIVTQKPAPVTFREFCELATWFHGASAPGVMIGKAMVEVARSLLPDGTLFQAVCETGQCLPDAVQLLTLCTIGNGRLKVMDVGRYALALYDKADGRGVRAYLDVARMQPYPEALAWLTKAVPKSEQDGELILREIERAGADMVSTETVVIADAFRAKHRKGDVGVCPSCGELYPLSSGRMCGGCRGVLPYMR